MVSVDVGLGEMLIKHGHVARSGVAPIEEGTNLRRGSGIFPGGILPSDLRKSLRSGLLTFDRRPDPL